MTGGAIPSDDKLRARLHKRTYIDNGNNETLYNLTDNLPASNSTVSGTEIGGTTIKPIRRDSLPIMPASTVFTPNSVGIAIVGMDTGC